MKKQVSLYTGIGWVLVACTGDFSLGGHSPSDGGSVASDGAGADAGMLASDDAGPRALTDAAAPITPPDSSLPPVCAPPCSGTCTPSGCVTTLLAPFYVADILATASHVYVTADGAILDIPVGGNPHASPTVLASSSGVSGAVTPQILAVDATNVYWTNISGGLDGSTNGSDVMRVPITGGSPTAIAHDDHIGLGIAVDSTNVYWTDAVFKSSNITTVPLGGSGTPKTLATVPTTVNRIWVNSAGLYYIGSDICDSGGGYCVTGLMRLPLAGGSPTPLTSGNDVVLGVDSTNVYFTEEDASGGSFRVMSVPGGGGTPATLATVPGNPTSITWYSPSPLPGSSTRLYWTTQGGDVMMMPLSGGAPTTLVTGQYGPQDIAVNAAGVYWFVPSSAAPTGALMMLTPDAAP